jgi:hypothetical protein
MNNFLSGSALEEYEFILIASVLAAVASFYYFVREWKLWHLIKDTPTARLRSAHQGYVELEGRGQLPQEHTIYAPLSNHKCVWYQSLIECKETILHKQRTRTQWKILYRNTSDHPFLLDDSTGTCMVNPDGAEIISNEKLVWYGNTEWPTRTKILDNGSTAMALTSRYRYSERLILPGQHLYIIGHLKTQSPSTERTVKDIKRELITDWKHNAQQLLERFDTNKDGEIDLAEWEIARQSALSEAQAIHQQLLNEPEVNQVSNPSNNQRPYIISVRPQAELIEKYRRNASIALISSLSLMGYVVWLLHHHG